MNHTAVLRTPLDAIGFKVRGCKRLPLSQGVFRTDGAYAVIESPVLAAPAPFDDLVGSWNAELPPGAKLAMGIQARIGRAWSRWYCLGNAVGRPDRRLEMASPPAQMHAGGSVAADTLRLDSPAEAFRYRLTLRAAGKPATLRLAAVTVSSPRAPGSPPPFRPGPWIREIPMRGRSQMLEPAACRLEICSPTSLAAVLEFWDRPRATLDVAERVRDRSTGEFGNWTFNVAAAAALGLEGYVARLESLDDLAAQIAAGRPVIVSVAFAAGELPGAPIPRTRGHLMVVAGFTPRGDVIVMDPAGRPASRTRRVYDRARFHKAWRVNKRGLSYVLSDPGRGLRLAVGLAAAELWSAPRRKPRPSLMARGRESQLLYGESLTVLSTRGNWAKVRAEEQAQWARGGAWHGYAGWIKTSALTGAPPPKPNVVVCARQAPLKETLRPLTLSMGTRLERLAQARGAARVRLLGGETATVSALALAAARPAASPRLRKRIVQAAELFLGTPYRWGGRCATGIDCSGLSSLVYRACGIDLPRNAHDQHLLSRKIRRADLKIGDLVFLTSSRSSRKVTHVMIYGGGETLIESRQKAGRTLRCSFARRFGARLGGLESDHVVTDLASSSRRRRIFFGSYF